jgi:hypothetical protein
MVFCGGAIMAQTNVQNTDNKTGSTIQNSTTVNPVSTNTDGNGTSNTDGNQLKKETIVIDGTLSVNPNKDTDKKAAVDLPGFPVYVNTGNKELDDNNYRIAKDLWIQNNQELYNSIKTKPTTNSRRKK